MIAISNSKRARILRYYRYQSAQAEHLAAEARKTVQQLNHRREALEQQAAALSRCRDALAAGPDAGSVTTAGYLDLCRQQMIGLSADTALAEDALRSHAQTTEAAQRILNDRQKQLQRLDLKQQLINRNVF
ncbi:hypothetical protein [Morganella morganii]|uniref:hypothetical protein n=1 Tax=Morganella morganii TaxID=582 RepID=UPI001C442C0B|nr:hypothetical protein [Morganella morganii]QXO64463.1 hypothetical protein JC825_13875 [Morganella morganii]